MTRRSVKPGMVKKVEYQKPKVYIENPTLQVVVEDLPVAEKSVLFTEHIVETITYADWMPPKEDIIKLVKPDMTEINYVAAEEKVVENMVDDIVDKVVEKAVEMPVEKRAEIQLEDVLNNIKPVEKPLEKSVENFDEKLAKTFVQSKKPVENLFEKLNENTVVEQKTVVNETDFKKVVKIDNAEIKMSKNSGYMLDKKACDKKKMSEYLQQIGGKILALDCKCIEMEDKKFMLSNNSYRSSDGEEISLDDMIAKIMQKVAN